MSNNVDIENFKIVCCIEETNNYDYILGIIAGRTYLATDSNEHEYLYKIYGLDKFYIGLYWKDRFSVDGRVDLEIAKEPIMSHIKVTCTDDCNAGPGVIAGQNYLATDSKEYTSLYEMYDLDKIYIGLYRKDRFTIISPVKEPTMTRTLELKPLITTNDIVDIDYPGKFTYAFLINGNIVAVAVNYDTIWSIHNNFKAISPNKNMEIREIA